QIESSPVVSSDGTLYVGVWGNYLYALNPNGTLKWRFEGLKQEKGVTVLSSPAIAEDGTIYIGMWDDYLYAIGEK
ncbi:MAG: PQQ-like beta-propeller repeat protein, partial [Caldiserica bacterium]|nr:PQQ-like beta-propeller repeat protein [Caldisericota bacterium]